MDYTLSSAQNQADLPEKKSMCWNPHCGIMWEISIKIFENNPQILECNVTLSREIFDLAIEAWNFKSNSENTKKIVCFNNNNKNKTNRKLTCDTVLLTKVQTLSEFYRLSQNFTDFHAVTGILFSDLIQDYTLYLVTLSSFSCLQKFLINTLFIFILLQIFSNFPCYSFLDTPTHHLKVDI